MVSFCHCLNVSRGLGVIEDNVNFKVINVVFPHIGEKLKLFWGCPEFGPYIDSLQTDTRGGSRAGFPGVVLNALFMLTLDHDKEFPDLLHKQTDKWASTWKR